MSPTTEVPFNPPREVPFNPLFGLTPAELESQRFQQKQVGWLGRNVQPILYDSSCVRRGVYGCILGTALSVVIVGAVLWITFGSDPKLKLTGQIFVSCGGVISLIVSFVLVDSYCSKGGAADMRTDE